MAQAYADGLNAHFPGSQVSVGARPIEVAAGGRFADIKKVRKETLLSRLCSEKEVVGIADSYADTLLHPRLRKDTLRLAINMRSGGVNIPGFKGMVRIDWDAQDPNTLVRLPDDTRAAYNLTNPHSADAQYFLEDLGYGG